MEPRLEAKAAIDALTRSFFRAFEPGQDGRVDLGFLRNLFIPEGILIKACGPVPEVYTLQQFIEPREKILNDGTLADFQEEETSERTDIFGHIACRFSAYHKQGRLTGQAFSAQGMKTFHFIRTSVGWRMSSLIWDDEREGLDIAKDYLPGEWCRAGSRS